MLWEYRGISPVNEFMLQQESGQQSMGMRNNPYENPGKDQKKEEEEVKKPVWGESKYFENWQMIRCWKHHQGSVYNLTWSPDSKHFATIGQDNKLYFCNIFDSHYISVIDTPATGLVWDPFGLFLAT
jgi:WD40 repeat protein